MSAMLTGAERIAAERQRQLDAEGWTPEHDDGHAPGDLLLAGICYALHARGREQTAYDWWPWDDEWFKPGDRVRDLEKAGALIAAEIDRLLRKRDGS